MIGHSMKISTTMEECRPMLRRAVDDYVEWRRPDWEASGKTPDQIRTIETDMMERAVQKVARLLDEPDAPTFVTQ